MVLRDSPTVVDAWFGFQVDGKLSLEMPNWLQFGAVIYESYSKDCTDRVLVGIFGEIMSDSKKKLKLSGDSRWLQKVALNTWVPCACTVPSNRGRGGGDEREGTAADMTQISAQHEHYAPHLSSSVMFGCYGQDLFTGKLSGHFLQASRLLRQLWKSITSLISNASCIIQLEYVITTVEN